MPGDGFVGGDGVSEGTSFPEASTAEGSVAGKKVLLCVTGGIAAYKVIEVARDLEQLGADVRVVMTPSAMRFVGPQTFATLSGHPVATELFGVGAEVPHVELARGASLAIVAPATANSIAKMALGFSDDLFSATMLTVRCPIVVVPAMHTEMWDHPATRSHIETLVERGVILAGPASGALSSGDRGPGRMIEPAEIVAAALQALARSHDLAGKKIVVTAGGTQEPIDPVRFIGNRSSGLMGYLIAREAVARGGKVVLISGPTNLTSPAGAELIPVKSTEDMRAAVFDASGDADAIVKAAAVADFKPEHSVPKKLKKAAGPPEIHLVPTPDILAELGHTPGARKPGGILVGFAAETEPDPVRLADLAEEKRRAKGADVVVANDVSSPDSGFEVHTNRAVIATPDGVEDVGLVTKEALAAALVDKIAEILDR
jgi:phosphopantothenoylcysteine decarboxylase/phosphopantothenate--cysteine ligase